MGKALVYGIFVHKILEEIELELKRGAAESKSLPEIVKPIWVKVKSGSSANGLDDTDLANAKKAVQSYIYHLESNGIPDILGVEEWFNITVGDFQIRGKIDLMTQEGDDIHVIDHKTTKLGSIKYLDENRTQLQIYAIAVAEKYGKPLENIKSSFSLISADFDKKTYSFGDEDIEEVKDFIVKSGEAIKNDTTWEGKTTILCAWCSYYDNCDTPKSKAIQSRREQVVAEA
jgi:CRISPR/Cas system-associated exonuclease Cas4 (RecB family)